MKETPPAPEEKNFPAVFTPYTQEELESFLAKLSRETHVDFTGLPIGVYGPGDVEFDFTEAQNKLFLKAGSLEKYQATLKKHNFTGVINREGVDWFRKIARDEGVDLDYSTTGFMYNRNGKINLLGIREDQVIAMARKYAGKEKEEMKIDTEEEAKEYIRYLAEKYLYHELGHTVYYLIPPKNLERWKNLVTRDKKLKECVVEVQIEKYPSPEQIPVPEEAFADIFAEFVTNGRAKNRLGEHAGAKEYVEHIMAEILASIEEAGSSSGGAAEQSVSQNV